MIIKFKQFETYICKSLEYSDSITESKGIPDTIKIFTEIIFNRIDLNETEYFIDINKHDLKIKNLKIKIEDIKIDTYKVYSLFGNFIDKQLVNPLIYIGFDFDKYNYKELKRIITHELLHIYEVYQRCKNDTGNGLQWVLLEKIQELRNKYEDDKFLSDLCIVIYYSSDQELNAVVAQTYTILMSCNSTDKKILSDEMNKSKSWNICNQLMLFDKKDYTINYDRCIEFFKELNKVMKVVSNKKYNIFDIPESKKDVDKIIKNYIYLFRKKGKYLKSKLIKVVGEVIKDINEFNSKEDIS